MNTPFEMYCKEQIVKRYVFYSNAAIKTKSQKRTTYLRKPKTQINKTFLTFLADSYWSLGPNFHFFVEKDRLY
jgi:hypothetical protein